MFVCGGKIGKGISKGVGFKLIELEKRFVYWKIWIDIPFFTI